MAIGGAAAAALNIGVTTAVSGSTSSFVITGTAYTPVIRVTTSLAGALTLSDVTGAAPFAATAPFVQRNNTAVVYFNNNTLDPASAQNAAFYQLVDTSNSAILLPSSVAYYTATNSAVLNT